MTPRPIIIIGMHRSGTSMITRLLEKLGLFAGWRKDPNHESLLFLRLNEWLLRQVGATWDNPEPVRKLLENADRRAQAVQVLRTTLNTWPAFGYMGPIGFLRYGAPAAMAGHWGWKDPRNTLTYPLWMDIFPDAKILHVTRHGVDVANSLTVREKQAPSIGHLSRFSVLGIIGHPEIAPSLHSGTLGDAFSLWEQYLTFADENGVACGGDHYQIRYEDFLENPDQYLADLAEFCGLQVTPAAIKEICTDIKRDRAFAYRGNPALEEFGRSVSDRLGRFNY